eukprot:163314_1
MIISCFIGSSKVSKHILFRLQKFGIKSYLGNQRNISIKHYHFHCSIRHSSSFHSFVPQYYDLATINYGHLTSKHPQIRLKEENKMLNAMEHIGFMVLTNHNISKYIMDDIWNTTKLFFDSSIENKLSIPMTKEYIYGYSANEILKQSEDGNTDDLMNDNKETLSFWIGAPNTNRLNNVLWPKEPLRLKDSYIIYYRECELIASQLLKSFANILELDDIDYFEQFLDDHMSALRTLNYPSQNVENNNNNNNNSFRCSAHTDYGTFTLLRQDCVGGLQVELNNEWVDVMSDSYDFIVNLGDLMKRWTNDRFKSTRHRVVNPRNEDEAKRRQSIAFFHNLNANALVETIPSCLDQNGKSKYEIILFEEFLRSKHDPTVTSSY